MWWVGKEYILELWLLLMRLRGEERPEPRKRGALLAPIKPFLRFVGEILKRVGED